MLKLVSESFADGKISCEEYNHIKKLVKEDLDNLEAESVARERAKIKAEIQEQLK